MVLGLPSGARAETLHCAAASASRLEAAGLVLQPDDFYGLAEMRDITVDTATGVLTAPSGPVPGLVKTSDFGPSTGADLVLSAPDGSMLFRARNLEGAIPFLLVDLYDVYLGTCRR